MDLRDHQTTLRALKARLVAEAQEKVQARVHRSQPDPAPQPQIVRLLNSVSPKAGIWEVTGVTDDGETVVGVGDTHPKAVAAMVLDAQQFGHHILQLYRK